MNAGQKRVVLLEGELSQGGERMVGTWVGDSGTWGGFDGDDKASRRDLTFGKNNPRAAKGATV